MGNSDLTLDNLFTNGDMEGAGSPPAPWSANGTNGGLDGSVTTSTDTPSGSGQSIQVIDFDGNLTTYGLDYTAQGGYPDGDYVLSYDYKGGFYGGLGHQNATLPGGFAPGAGSTEWFSVADWTHYEKTITVEGGGVDGFSFTIWNNHDQGRPALIDNVSLTPASQPEPPQSR